jgi:hypothetical protein
LNKQYIGDGVYVEIDELGLVLTTENGIETTNRIVLEGDVYGALEQYVARTRRKAADDSGGETR